jgi:hypothetical protein
LQVRDGSLFIVSMDLVSNNFGFFIRRSFFRCVLVRFRAGVAVAYSQNAGANKKINSRDELSKLRQNVRLKVKNKYLQLFIYLKLTVVNEFK